MTDADAPPVAADASSSGGDNDFPSPIPPPPPTVEGSEGEDERAFPAAPSPRPPRPLQASSPEPLSPFSPLNLTNLDSPTTPMSLGQSDNDNFLRWARGDDVPSDYSNDESNDEGGGTRGRFTPVPGVEEAEAFMREEVAKVKAVLGHDSESDVVDQGVKHVPVDTFSRWVSGYVSSDDSLEGVHVDDSDQDDDLSEDTEARSGGDGPPHLSSSESDLTSLRETGQSQPLTSDLPSVAPAAAVDTGGSQLLPLSSPTRRPRPLRASDRAVTMPGTKSEIEWAIGAESTHPLKNESGLHPHGSSLDAPQSVSSGINLPRPPFHSEVVYLPRPLFFGNALSPRILKEAKRASSILASAHEPEPLRKPWDEVDISLSGCRNLEGVLLAYGMNTKALSGGIHPSSEAICDGFVTTYQPVWGDDVRKDREMRRQRASANEVAEEEMELDALDLRDQGSGEMAVGEDAPSSKIVLEKKLARAADESNAQSVKNMVAKLEGAVRPVKSDPDILLKDDRVPSVATPADNLFLQWARGGAGGDGGGTWGVGGGTLVASAKDQSSAANAQDATEAQEEEQPFPVNPLLPDAEDNQFLKWARGNDDLNAAGTFVAPKSDRKANTAQSPLGQSKASDENQFLKWARGAGPGLTGEGTFVDNSAKGVTDSKGGSPRRTAALEESDSFEDSELKRQVGMNDNLSAALALLQKGDDGGNGDTNRTESMAAAEAGAAALHAADGLILTKNGRLKTNLEMTGGREPIYSCDDTPLPIEADLGVFETKEDQVKSKERRKNQELIQSIAVPHVFGPLSCPSTSTSPDDAQSWNSRSRRSLPADDPVTRESGSSMAGSRNRKLSIASSGSFSQGSVKSAMKLPPPPPPITEDATFQKNQRGAYPGAGGAGKISKLASPSVGSQVTHASGPSARATSARRRNCREAVSKVRRIGWWECESKNEGDGDFSGGVSSEVSGASASTPLPTDASIQLPSDRDDSSGNINDSICGLYPSPRTLKKQNKSLTELHSATTTARHLPFLSDRAPGMRYLQIDTKAVEFTPTGEIEPFFCTMAIWHVETAAEVDAPPGSVSTATASKPSQVPVPDLRRCGRITESFYFDAVSDPEVQERCATSLWARAGRYAEDGIPPWDETSTPSSSSPKISIKKPSGKGFKDGVPVNVAESERLSGTRCGVFPLPSNFSISNLYAVLIIHKVLAEDSEVEPYLKSSGQENYARSTTPKPVFSEISKWRSKAERSSDRLGRFVMPFAFGVAPLLQVIGAEVPTIPSSRAVQIPLFKIEAGKGERPIIDHIMVMLYPRSELHNKPAELTKGGSAMLVMRNFGYLGLQSVVNSKSSLARDRLVDFTGDFQLRRRTKKERKRGREIDDDSGRTYVASQWQPQFIAEPTSHGGRNVAGEKNKKGGKTTPRKKTKAANSPLYSQEVAAIPLSFTPPSGRGGSSSASHGKDAEVNFYTTFCNELICQPRLLHNCTKKNIVIKVEVREIKWSEWMNAYIALRPSSGASIHNPRRGRFLVREAYTSCAYQTLNPAFLDDFKIKLPLVLDNDDKTKEGRGKLVLLFSILDINVKGKRRWKDKLLRHNKKNEMPSPESPDGDGDSDNDRRSGSGSYVQNLGCGFMALTVSGASKSDPPCLITNGLHDVKIKYHSKAAPSSLDTNVLDLNKTGRGSPYISDTGMPNIYPVERSGKITFPSGALILESLDVANSVANSSVSDLGSLFSNTPETLKEGGEEAQMIEGGGVLLSPTRSDSAKLTPTHSSIASSSLSQTGSLSPIATNRSRDLMILQVRTISLSSVHPQNRTLSKFFHSRPNFPRSLTAEEISSTSTPWNMPRADLLLKIDKERDLRQSVSSKNILQTTIELAKSSFCPQAELSSHLLRILPLLLRASVSGEGDPSLLWANPATLIPLRLHSFASLFHTISAVTMYLAKNGVTQLDGRRQWNLVSMAYVVGMIFDEEALFASSDGPLLEDIVDVLDFQKLGTRVKMKLLVPIPIQAPEPLTRARSESLDLPYAEEMKVDSKADFLSALRKAGSEDKGGADSSSLDGFSFSATSSSSSNTTASGVVSGFTGTGSGPVGNRRRFMTAPSSVLATIKEDAEAGDRREAVESFGKMMFDDFSSSKKKKFGNEALVDNAKRSGVKQMRVPNVKKTSNTLPADIRDIIIPDDIGEIPSNSPPAAVKKDNKDSKALLLDDEIQTAGSEFLDQIGESLGYAAEMQDIGGEERRVGIAHHRKTRSRCSIDWTKPARDFDENLNKGRTGKANDPNKASLDSTNAPVMTGNEPSPSIAQEPYIKLPGFVDRIAALGRKGEKGRWFAYTYEVVIFQWFALLVEQTKSVDQAREVSSMGSTDAANAVSEESNVFSYRVSPGTIDPTTAKSLKEAALKARGVTIACAPILFELIKKSLGWRIDSIFGRGQKFSNAKSKVFKDVLPLVTLDTTLMSTLEDLISMVTDACIDSRNFDSWQFRQTAIEVNNSIARFLRNLFALLDPKSVHRLVLVYFSRFVMKEGKHWKDRDSKIGLRCSWETCKLRLDAVTLFARLPDFHYVNFPYMNSWGHWLTRASERSTISFFDNAIEELGRFDMSMYTGGEATLRHSTIQLPELRPHWLVELVTDICLSATGHAEQNIQHRASSLLHELFWAHSQRCKVNGTLPVAASMYVPFVMKLLGQINYLSSLPAKNQLRKDILPCVVFVLQNAPVGLMRALWRKLCRRAEGKGIQEKYGGMADLRFNSSSMFASSARNVDDSRSQGDHLDEETDDLSLPDILDMFGLLNLALSTLEYEGGESNSDENVGEEAQEQVSTWRREFLLAVEQENYAIIPARPRPFPGLRSTRREEEVDKKTVRYTTSSSRKWYSNDCAIVVMNTSRYIVREVQGMLKPEGSDKEEIDFAVLEGRKKVSGTTEESGDDLNFSVEDAVVFVRGALAVYLHSLCLRESDVVVIKTLIASTEVVRMFGIKLFLTAVGETLQHWMRIVLSHCGARRAAVRIQALEFLALISRLTWDSYGSFHRIRIPMLAVQTEVMERIVATAATRYYREQRRLGNNVQYLTNDSAEASLSPFWRTLDRLHHQSASQNIAFRSALQRLAIKMKKLFRAYIAAHALAIVNRLKASSSPNFTKKKSKEDDDDGPVQPAYIHNSLVSVHRILANSAGFSKQFLGIHGAHSSPSGEVITHNESIEDAFLEAADVFSSTELPSHRVAWLRKLADFHSSRNNFAEEASCRFNIHYTLRQAAQLHESLWASVPFLPWASDQSDGVHLEGDGPASGDVFDADYDSEDLSMDGYIFPDTNSEGKHLEKNQSFRRIFYRVANSVRLRTGDWDVGGNKTLFYGVTFASEYDAFSSWISLREMEEDMIEEAETAGDLYLKAGIVESSRFAWSLATQFYADNYNYARLAHVYRRLAMVVESQVPVVDTSNQLELSSPLGRFYRVYFHGDAPDELIGAEFVYRAAQSVKLEKFGKILANVFKSILPDNTPIDLVLDDGRPDDSSQKRPQNRGRFGAAQREAIKIKVTPLRPLLKNESTFRGTPEWFYRQTDHAGASSSASGQSYHQSNSIRRAEDGTFSNQMHSPRQRSRSISSVPSSNGGSTAFSMHGNKNPSHGDFGAAFSGTATTGSSRGAEGGDLSVTGGGEIVGVDRFSFTQPTKKHKARNNREWLTTHSGDFAEKSLRVTQITVEKCFPSCISRQNVVHRSVFNQSPLEASVEAVCSWCAVLFRTAVATNGLSVIGPANGQGIGTAAAKVVADCIHSSRVRELGNAFLSRTGYFTPEDEAGDDTDTMLLSYSRLSPSEVSTYQIKLARAVVMFMELLHLLIAKNRDILLEIVQARKRGMRGSSSIGSRSERGTHRQGHSSGLSPESVGHHLHQHQHQRSMSKSMYASSSQDRKSAYGQDNSHRPHYMDAGGTISGISIMTGGGPGDRTDSAIAVQSELQRAFISMAKILYPLLSSTIQSETPRWLQLCSQDNYFSSGTYRQTRIAMGEDLFFIGGSIQAATRNAHGAERYEEYHQNKPEPYGVPISIIPTRSDWKAGASSTPDTPTDGSYDGSAKSKASRVSKRSEQQQTVQPQQSQQQDHRRQSPSHSSSVPHSATSSNKGSSYRDTAEHS